MSETLLRLLGESALRVSLVAAVVAPMLAACRVRAGRPVHAAWTAVLFAMLLMPMLPYLVPAIPIPLGESLRIVDNGDEQPSFAHPVVPSSILQIARSEPGTASSPAGSRAGAAEAPSERGPSWSVVALIIYVVGVTILLCRLLMGWGGARRVAGRGQRVNADRDLAKVRPTMRDVPIAESTDVMIPVTIGVIVATVVLPVTWRQWSGDTLRAVLAHERAHVKRRDPLVGFLARLNCCVFWFHPLAWWLERKLASTAEHACDDAAVRAVGESGRYVEILIEMAETVRAAGGRLSWQGVGMDGGRMLGRRIDRLLAGNSWPGLSRGRTAVVAATCAVAIVLAAACQREVLQPKPLRDSPNRTPEQAQQIADERFHRADREMPPEVAAELEASLKTTPDDLVVRERLLFFYWAQLSPPGATRSQRLVAARRALALWLIDHRPDSSLAGSAEARLLPGESGALTDSAGYEEAKRRWLAQVARSDASATVLANAANFFEGVDKSRAEALLARAQAQDPGGPWSRRLGAFYAAALVGRWVATAVQQPGRDVSGRDRQGPYADVAHTRLVESTDDGVLVAAAQYLLGSPRNDPRQGLDRDLLAQTLLERALHFNPASTDIHANLVSARARNRSTQTALLFSKTPRISMYDAAHALPEAQRFDLLPDLALTEYSVAVGAERWDDAQDYVKTGLDISRKCAEELLRLAPALRADPTYGTAVYKANIVLASLALRARDRKGAVRYLRAASEAPVSEELAYSRGIAGGWPLVRELLTQGERAPVIEFLERMAQVNVVRRADLREAAAAIRRGEMPELGPTRTSRRG